MRPPFNPPALQAIRRDFAFIVPVDLPAATLVKAVRGADTSITDARVFDRFESDAGLSLGIEATLQPGVKTFTDADIAEISTRIVAAAGNLGARLRN